MQNVSLHIYFPFFFQLVEAVSTPGDIRCLIGPVVKLLPSYNINVKRTAYSVLPRYTGLHDIEPVDGAYKIVWERELSNTITT
jgi:hypothetical protein